MVVGPGGGFGQCPPDGDGHGVGREPEQHGVLRKGGFNSGGQVGRRRTLRQSRQCPIDGQQRLVRFKEEVAAQGHVCQGAVRNVEVNHHELAARDLVLAVQPRGSLLVCRTWRGSHAFHPAPQTQKARTVAGAGFPKNLGEK